MVPTETALLPAPFWCSYAWNPPTSTGAGGSDPLWLCWRGKPLARDPLARLRRIQVVSIGTTINFRPAAITHRDIAASALLIPSSPAPAALWRGGKRASSPGGERCSPWSFRHGCQKPAVRRASLELKEAAN